MLLHLSKLLVTMLMVLLIQGSPVFSLPTDDTNNHREIERVEIYHVVESWLDTFLTGWRSDHSTGHQSAAATVKLGELPEQKLSKPKDLYLAAASDAMTVTPTSSSTPSMYRLLKHTTPI